MKLILFCVLFHSIAGLRHEVYHITPQIPIHNVCSVNGTALSPCHSLEQFIAKKILISSNESSVEVVFLPETHVIPKNHSFKASHFSAVDIHSWDEELEVLINCQSITELKIISLHFAFCSLQYSFSDLGKSVFITRSVFEGTRKTYCISILADSELNGTISNCKFLEKKRQIINTFAVKTINVVISDRMQLL